MRATLGHKERDVYANLLRETRGMRRDQARARDAWYAALPWDRKEETLFALEMLLKGIGCFGNARNHPGPPRRTPSVAHDFQEELRVLREATDHSVDLIRELLGDRDRAYTFTRYLESLQPEDGDRTKFIKDQLAQDTPVEALFVLRNGLSGMIDITDGLLRHGRISHRLFLAVQNQIIREIGRNAYFNPLVTLEFRPEFDRIRSAEVLEALENLPSDASHRVCALVFLALFRSLRYLELIDRWAADKNTARLGYVVLAVLRSDVRALTRFIGKQAADAIADGFERDLLAVGVESLKSNYEELAHVAASLVSLRGTLEAIANTLRLETRKVFERELPSVEGTKQPGELGAQIVVATASLRASIHHTIQTLCTELQPQAGAVDLGDDVETKRLASDRLRRDVWMFAQIVRAFLAKANAAPADADQWSVHASFQFVREFLSHFRAIGYQLVRTSDYDRLDPFLGALEDLRDVDLLEHKRLTRAVHECGAFYEYLEELFRRVNKRSELKGVPFDKKRAAETLKIYLGAA
jgi:hypothetical protein